MACESSRGSAADAVNLVNLNVGCRRENRAAQRCNMASSQCSIFKNCLLTGSVPVFIGQPIKFSYEPQTKTNKQTKNKIK